MNEWDPIGVQGVPEAQDEYDSYIGGVYVRLIRHVAPHELIDYLWEIETKHMCLFGNRRKTERTVDLLFKLREEMEAAV